jgi:glutathione S-transferase
MLKVYGFSKVNAVARDHTRDLRVLWALEEMQLPFELAGMDHPAHDLNTEPIAGSAPSNRSPRSTTTGWCCPNPPPFSSTWRRSPAA